MKTYGENDLRSTNWGGLRSTLKAPLYWRSINAALVGVLAKLPQSKLRSRVPVMQPFAEYEMASGARVRMMEPHRCSVARNLFWSDGTLPSKADMDAIRMAEKLAENASTFLDIGAYSGLFALVAARANPVLRAIAFEILPSTFLLAMRNAIANDLHDRVEPRLQGLGRERGTLVLPLETELDGLPTSLSLGSSFSNGVRIPVVRLDDMEDVEGPIAIKIDVEGFEADVLVGGAAFIEKHKPDIICEILRSSGCAPEIERLLKPLGYRFHLFTEGGLEERATLEPTRDGRDWLFSVRAEVPTLK